MTVLPNPTDRGSPLRCCPMCRRATRRTWLDPYLIADDRYVEIGRVVCRDIDCLGGRFLVFRRSEAAQPFLVRVRIAVRQNPVVLRVFRFPVLGQLACRFFPLGFGGRSGGLFRPRSPEPVFRFPPPSAPCGRGWHTGRRRRPGRTSCTMLELQPAVATAARHDAQHVEYSSPFHDRMH